MSISVNLRRISNLPGRSDRKVELCFRGFIQKTRVLQSENVAIFNEIYIELDIHYHPVEGSAGKWDGLDFLKAEDKDESALVIRNDGFDDPESQNTLIRPDQLEREVRRLGRSLLGTGDEDDDCDDDYDEDLMDLEASNITVTPLLRVGDQKRHTATQKSTNCPFYNENFQFEFQEAPQILFDKVIEIKVFHRRTLAFLMTHIGTFKIDISTVYNQPDHRFYQKWAPLTDPADTRSGIKGYVKASLSVLMKGDAMSMASLLPTSTSGASEDIEKNLLLPRGMASERPWARFRVRIYRAEGLPTMDSGLMAKMSKVTDRTVFIDPYVQVTFAGQQGETTVASVTSCPVWNEEINFIEQFPPLAQRIRVQILDDAKMGDIALATHFLDLQQISDPTRNGFNPTCGPCWVNLYGSPQNSTLGDVHQVKGTLGKLGLRRKRSSKKKQNEASIAASGLVSESGDAGVEVPEVVAVETEEIHPLPEGFLGEREDFLLFASLFEFTMIDPSVGTKPLTFELSIGNYGKVVSVRRSKKSQSREELRRSREELRSSRENLNEDEQGLLESEEELDREEVLSLEPENRSVSVAMKPQPTEYDRSYQCLPLQPPSLKQKPCLFVWSQFEDHSFRLHQANWLSKMADRLEIGLDEVERLLRRPRSNAKERLVEVLLEMVASCKQFNIFAERRSQSRPNNLDRCRKEFIKKNLVLLARQAVRAKRRITRRTAKQRLMDARKLLKKLRLLAKESPGSSASEIFAKLEVYLWLGLAKYSKVATNSLPEEFLPVYEEEEEELRRLVPAGKRTLPVSLSCQDSRFFQLRCHLYQGRGLMAADDNGLSDPFAKVLFSTQCQVTRMLSDTLSPAWCECLLFDQVLLEGTREELERDPPLIIINIFDYDSMGSPKPLGRAFAEPEFKPVEQFYKKPSLRFFDINLGRAPAGELLAAFELIELDYSGLGEPCLPSSVDPQELTYVEEQKYYAIPEGVRPVLKTFRIEVLFWGLRELKRVQLFEVERPLVRVECAGRQLESEEIESYKVHPNFKELVRYIDVELPEQAYLHPPLTLFVVEHRAFGRLALVGSHVVQSLMYYAPPELGGREEEEEEEPKQKASVVRKNTAKINSLTSVKKMGLSTLSIKQSKIPMNTIKLKLMKKKEELEEEMPEKEELDWWSKYYASLDEMERKAAKEEEESEEQADTDGANLTMANIEEEEEDETVVIEIEPPKRKAIATLKMYGGDLESEFSQFQDWLQIFPLYKGRSCAEDEEDDDEERVMGKYKGSFLVYPINAEDTEDTKCQITEGIPKNSPIKVLVRVYVVKVLVFPSIHSLSLSYLYSSIDLLYPVVAFKTSDDARTSEMTKMHILPLKTATSLAPTDPNGKADPYLVIKVGQQSLDTKDRYIPKQLNPTFGEVFELTVSFPLETELAVTVMDHDLVGSDDVIGETRVDLENRFYSRHRACCGLALHYDTLVPKLHHVGLSGHVTQPSSRPD
ncbi:hypothetical protein F2P81_012498 [Scophthalmus maximus]|uniref:C2 domain-containing protein n=1 Tax=Scophthalmus maximus TaxID=52904 RepID=A0A6A4SSA0_SCOMX|nr:hypothetical protein F2P81_012498 [Scophthalmus maximus]